MARDMMVKYGMDEELWTLQYLDNEYNLTKSYSEATAIMIDQKVKEVVRLCYLKAKEVLKSDETLIRKLASILDLKEYLTREEFGEIMWAKDDQVDEIIERLREEYNTTLAK